METIEYRTQNKSSWGGGEWDNEPDKRQWLDPHTGYPCLIVRNHHGALCGYVGLLPEHPFHGKGYHEDDLGQGFDVHGNITFAGACEPDGCEETDICHIGPQEPWWFGFDCSHGGDLCPARQFRDSMGGFTYSNRGRDIYRNMKYVEEQVRSLAIQLKDCEIK